MSFTQQVQLRRAASQGAAVSGQPVHASRPQRQRRCQAAPATECNAGAAAQHSVKLPASHLQSSQAALQQLQATKAVNRKSGGLLMLLGHG